MTFLKPPMAVVVARKILEYKSNKRLSRPEFEAMQLRKFRRLMAYAQPRSPYYAAIIKDRGIDVATCTPDDFPVLTKSLLMANFDDVATDRRITRAGIEQFLSRSTDPNERYKGEYQVCHSSGSSGEIGYFVYSRNDWGRGMAQHARSRTSLPWPGTRQRLAFVGAASGHFLGVSTAAAGGRGLNALVAKVAICEVNEPLSVTIDTLNAFQPEQLTGYTTTLCMLAEKQQQGILRISPKRIDAGGEVVTPASRALLTNVFGAEVFNIYACTEHQLIGRARPGAGEMVLFDDDLICDIHDDHMLVTNLFNYSLPLVRYRMSDVLRMRPSSGRHGPYRELEGVVGRTETVPAFINRHGDEDFISPITIAEIFVSGIRRIQMHLLSKTSFRFLACVADDLTEAEEHEAISGLEQRLRAILVQKHMDNVTFEVVRVDDLPLDPETRKFRLIVDASKPESAPA